MSTTNQTHCGSISVGSIVHRIGSRDLRHCGEVSRVTNDAVCIAWAVGGESELRPMNEFERITDVALKREVTLAMLRVSCHA